MPVHTRYVVRHLLVYDYKLEDITGRELDCVGCHTDFDHTVVG
jgi:hypothetical protein